MLFWKAKGAPMTTHALCTATSAIRDLYVGGASLDDIRNQHTAFLFEIPQKLVDKLMRATPQPRSVEVHHPNVCEG